MFDVSPPQISRGLSSIKIPLLVCPFFSESSRKIITSRHINATTLQQFSARGIANYLPHMSKWHLGGKSTFILPGRFAVAWCFHTPNILMESFERSLLRRLAEISAGWGAKRMEVGGALISVTSKWLESLLRWLRVHRVSKKKNVFVWLRISII